MAPGPPILILNAGGMRSLVAAAAALSTPHKPPAYFLHVRDGRGNAQARLDHARRQAEYCGARRFIDLDLPRPTGPRPAQAPGETPDPLTHARILAAAMAQALAIKAERIVWPVHSNADHTLAARAAERALLIEQIAELEHDRPPEIDMPLLELTDRQLVELGAHMDVPWRLARTCTLNQEEPCRVCPACRRRIIAFEDAAVPDPIDPAVAAHQPRNAPPPRYNAPSRRNRQHA